MNAPEKHINYLLAIGLSPLFFAADGYAVIAMALWPEPIIDIITIITIFNQIL